jgi:uncharacterized alkaline shock family protein YloU
MTGPELSVARRVILEIVERAATEVPGVVRVGRGDRWDGWFGRPPVIVTIADGSVTARVWLVARSGQALAPLSDAVHVHVAAALERLLDLETRSVTVVVDGVGA